MTQYELLSQEVIHTWGEFPGLRNFDFEVIFISMEAKMCQTKFSVKSKMLFCVAVILLFTMNILSGFMLISGTDFLLVYGDIKHSLLLTQILLNFMNIILEMLELQ